MRAGSFESAAMSSAAAKTSEEAGAARVRKAVSSASVVCGSAEEARSAE